MTRKDFEAIARALATLRLNESAGLIEAQHRAVVMHMALNMHIGNPHFDIDRFVAAALD